MKIERTRYMLSHENFVLWYEARNRTAGNEVRVTCVCKWGKCCPWVQTMCWMWILVCKSNNAKVFTITLYWGDNAWNLNAYSSTTKHSTHCHCLLACLVTVNHLWFQSLRKQGKHLNNIQKPKVEPRNWQHVLWLIQPQDMEVYGHP